eukprot:g17509.t1
MFSVQKLVVLCVSSALAKQYGVAASGKVEQFEGVPPEAALAESEPPDRYFVAPAVDVSSASAQDSNTALPKCFGTIINNCTSDDPCYLECRGNLLSGSACMDREVLTGTDCNNGYVKGGDRGIACKVDPDDPTRCIEKHQYETSETCLLRKDDAELVIWAGLVLRRTPRCILERCGESVAPRAGGVFVQSLLAGSPAETQSLHPHCFLMELNGKAVRSLSDVLLLGQHEKKPPSA